MTFVYVLIIVIITFYVYSLVRSNANANKYGKPSIYLKEIIDPLRLSYPNYKLVNENKGRIKYEFYDNLFVLTFDFIYQPNKIQITVTQNSVLGKKMKSGTCNYNLNDVRDCCNDLVKNILVG